MGQIKANYVGEYYNEGYWIPQFQLQLNTHPSINKDGKTKYAQFVLSPVNRNLFIFKIKIKNKIINLEFIFPCLKNKKSRHEVYRN